jgi:hypothetical protein
MRPSSTLLDIPRRMPILQSSQRSFVPKRSDNQPKWVALARMRVREGVAIDSLKFHLGLQYPTPLYFVGGPRLKPPYRHFRRGPPAKWAACSRILPLWTPHAIRLCWLGTMGQETD